MDLLYVITWPKLDPNQSLVSLPGWRYEGKYDATCRGMEVGSKRLVACVLVEASGGAAMRYRKLV